MTDLADTASVAHPLDRLTEAESAAAVTAVRADGRFSTRMRFVATPAGGEARIDLVIQPESP